MYSRLPYIYMSFIFKLTKSSPFKEYRGQRGRIISATQLEIISDLVSSSKLLPRKPVDYVYIVG